jgi:hypothetical protein
VRGFLKEAIMEKKYLTSTQQNEMDTHIADRKALKITLRIATEYHANAMSCLVKKEDGFWGELRKVHNLDPLKTYRVNMSSGRLGVFIEEVGKKQDT